MSLRDGRCYTGGMSESTLEQRVTRLEEAVRLLGRDRTIRDQEGNLLWPLPEFDEVGDEGRAQVQDMRDQATLRRAPHERRRPARRGHDPSALNRRIQEARGRLEARGLLTPDLADLAG